MKRLKVTLCATASTARKIEWAETKRIILRTEIGILLGTVRSNDKGRLTITLDGGDNLEVSTKSPSILGEGLNRKRKTIIPDDELFAWKRELCAEHLGR